MSRPILKATAETINIELTKLLTAKKIRLQKYALRKDANEKAIEIQEEELNHFYAIREEINQLLEEYDIQLALEFTKGYNKANKKDSWRERHPQYNEEQRHDSIFKLMKEMPQLF